MREIKFRAWDTERKEMVDDFNLNSDGCAFTCFGGYGCDRCPEMFILMQYTGLKDKSGREIYEGDLICWRPKGYYSHCNQHGQVVWDDKLGKWHFGYGGGSSTRKHSYTFKGVQDIEVIGNIHENPELLEQK